MNKQMPRWARNQPRDWDRGRIKDIDGKESPYEIISLVLRVVVTMLLFGTFIMLIFCVSKN